MCGIAGLVSMPGGLASQSISVMLDAQSHRGPDGREEWQSVSGICRLGHNRLAIIDVEGGSQPLEHKSAGLSITFNGCIYNYRELRSELISLGCQFKTKTDTEVILHAYAVWGANCLKRLNGMFAFAIWSESERRLFCARDRLGLKPFYFMELPNGFAFGSEIKALLALPKIPRKVNHSVLQDYLVMQSPLSDETLFHGILRLQPGHFIIVDDRGAVLKRYCYWRQQFSTPNEERPNSDELENLNWLLEDSVRLQLRSDVALGSYLSGGLDSSLLVALCSRINQGRGVKVFSGAFDYPGYDETKYARLAAEAAGSELFEVRPGPSEFADQISSIIWHMDEPTGGPGVFPQYNVAKLASDHVKVTLSGQGGDEVFAGYVRYLLCFMEEMNLRSLKEGGTETNLLKKLDAEISQSAVLRSYAPMIKRFWSRGLSEPHDKRYFQLLDRSTQFSDLYQRDVFLDNKTFERFSSIFLDSDAQTFVNKIIHFDTRVHLQGLLQVEDRVSMASGLETRAPLLDHRIVEFMASLSVEKKIAYGEPKAFLRRVAKNIVPSNIALREDKMGFPVPFNKWIREELKTFVLDILLSRRARERGIYDVSAIELAMRGESEFGRGIWGLLCLELWHRQFIDNN